MFLSCPPSKEISVWLRSPPPLFYPHKNPMPVFLNICPPLCTVHLLETPPEVTDDNVMTSYFRIGSRPDVTRQSIHERLRADRRTFLSIQKVHAGALLAKQNLQLLLVVLHC